MFIASLFLTIGAMAQVVADGVYTIQADVNGKRGYMAAANNQTRPVLTDITYSGYEGKGCSATDLVENSKYWYVKNVNGNVYIYNIGKGMFINGDNGDAIFFGETAYAVKAQSKTSGTDSYIQVYTIKEAVTGNQNRYLSLGCSRDIPNQVNWDTNGDDSGNFLVIKPVENGITTYATQIAVADAIISPEEPEVETPVVEENKEYYLVNNDGTAPVYFKLLEQAPAGSNQGTGKTTITKDQTVKFEIKDGNYVLYAMYDAGTGAVKKYLGASSDWAMGTVGEADAFTLEFEPLATDNTKYYIKIVTTGKYLKVDNGGVYIDGEVKGTSDTRAVWTIEEAVAEPEEPEGPAAEPLTYVSQSPAENVQVESLAEVTFEFNKPIKLDWEDPYANGTGTGGAGTGDAINYIKLKARDGSDNNAATAWFSAAKVDGNKITFKFEAPVTKTNTYIFTIPADLIIAAEGDEKFAGGDFKFKVNAPVAPVYKSCKFEPQPDWINCYTLEQIKVTFSEKIEIVGTDALELKNGEDVVATITDMEVGTDGKSLYLYLDDFITPEVTTEYSLVIPAGYVKTAGTNLGLANDAIVKGTVKARFVVKDIEPDAAQTVEAIENIVVEFNMVVNPNTANNLVLRNDENGEEVALTASLNEEGKVLTLTPTRPVVNGAYTLRQEKLATSNGLQVIAAAGGDAIYQAPLYTITVAGPELDELVPTSADRNPLTTSWEGEYKLQGVKINFGKDNVVKKYDTTTNDGDYGYILDANGNKVAKLDKCMGGNGTSNEFATPYSSTEVTTPGTYKVVVYGGVIYSADGEAVFNGGEYEFTVAEHPVEIESIYAPDAEVTSMRYCLDYEITINYYNTVEVDAEQSVTMTVGDKTYTAEVTPVEESWGYVISIAFNAEEEYAFGDYTLRIPAGLYTVNGVANDEEVYNFTYTDVQPIAVVGVEVEKDDNGAIVSISFEFNQSVSANEEFNLGDCKFMKSSAIASQWATYYAVTEDGEYSALTTPGEYSLYIQQVVGWNAILADDQQAIYTFNVAGEVKEVTATVTYLSTEQIDAIKVEFSDDGMYDCIFGYLFLRKGNDTYYLLAAPDYGKGVFVVVDPRNDDEPIVITEPGTYTLDLSSLADYGLTGDMEFSWTIAEGETTAIDAVDAEAENAVIYDLTGRRIEKITKAGIYVINGVKKVVK